MTKACFGDALAPGFPEESRGGGVLGSWPDLGGAWGSPEGGSFGVVMVGCSGDFGRGAPLVSVGSLGGVSS